MSKCKHYSHNTWYPKYGGKFIHTILSTTVLKTRKMHPILLCCLLLLFVLGLQAVRHAQIMRRCGLEQVCCSNPVPTSDSGQSSPRFWVPNPNYLSPTRRSKPAFQWQGTNERIHRQWHQGTKQTKDRHGGHQFHIWGISVTSLVTQRTWFFCTRTPRETITQQRENSLLRVGLNIFDLPFRRFSDFRNYGLEPVTPSIGNTKVFRSEPLAHAGTSYYVPTIPPSYILYIIIIRYKQPGSSTY